jgi:hypothetical protein
MNRYRRRRVALIPMAFAALLCIVPNLALAQMDNVEAVANGSERNARLQATSAPGDQKQARGRGLEMGVAGLQASIQRCFVRNCNVCIQRNPYICMDCLTGYLLTQASSCNSCAPNHEQNLDERAFICIRCPTGMWSPGGAGTASQCHPGGGH